MGELSFFLILERCLRRGLHAGGSCAGVPEGEEKGYQRRSLKEGASVQELILPRQVRPDPECGREYEVLYDSASKRWLKSTQPFHAGYIVRMVNEVMMLPATPLQDLQR